MCGIQLDVDKLSDFNEVFIAIIIAVALTRLVSKVLNKLL